MKNIVRSLFCVEGYEVKDGEQPGFSGIDVVVGDEEDYTGRLVSCIL